MGSPAYEENRSSDEGQVQVRISKAFWLSENELTQAQWSAAMLENPITFKGDDRPVKNVSWNDAQEFLKKVNDSGILPPGWKMALPTEAQWEYACRAGTSAPYANPSLNALAWYDDLNGGTHPVATKAPNAWGLHDMHGNVWEWCADWYDNTLAGGVDPKGSTSGLGRVYRGGSWFVNAARCRSSQRGSYDPTIRNDELGFRPALVTSE